MAFPSAPEAIGRAVVKEAIPATPARRSADAMAANMAKKAAEGNWREALNVNGSPAIDAQKQAARIGQLGTERDPATGDKKPFAPGSPEEKRSQEAKAYAKLAEDFDTKGYDVLPAGDKAALRRLTVEQARKNPLYEQQLRAIDPTFNINNPQIRDFAERMLREDPRFKGHLREVFNRMAQQPSIEGAFETAEDAHKLADVALKAAETDSNDIDGRLTAVTDRLKAYERPSGGVAGTKAAEIDALEVKLPTLNADVRTNTQKLEPVKAMIEDLRAERIQAIKGATKAQAITDIDDQIAKLIKNKLNPIQISIDKAQSEIERLGFLKEEEKQLQLDKQNLTGEKATKEQIFNEKKIASARALRELSDAKRLRDTQENDLAGSYENAFREAASLTFQDQVQEMQGFCDQELEALKQEVTSEQEKALVDAMRDQWTRELPARRGVGIGLIRVGGREARRPINRVQVAKDYGVLMTQGPEGVMRELLLTRPNPDSTATPPANYTQAEADAIIGNKAYADKMQGAVVKQLIERKVMSGGVNPEDAYVITSSDWGQGMIKQALESRAGFRKEVEGLMGEGALNQPGFFRNFGEQMRRHPAWWLMLIGAPIAFAVGAANATVGDNIAA